MGRKLKENKPYESALQRLIRRELKSLDKKLAEIDSLMEGDWYRDHRELKSEIIETTIKMKPEEAAEYLLSVAPKEKALAKKAKQSMNVLKLFDQKEPLDKDRRELQRALKRIVEEDEALAAFWAEHEAGRAY
jgi:hypothetical protein